MTISVCMIVKNEEDVLERCLNCVKQFADEIVIVDTGSTDATKDIAKNFTPNVYDFEWVENFSAARNFSFEKATKDYCMWLDADDIIDAQSIKELNALKKTLPADVNVVYMKYNTGFDASGNVTFSYFRERIIKRDAGMLWQGAVHEAIASRGRRVHINTAVTHKKLKVKENGRNLRIYESEISKGNELAPRDKFYFGRELFYHQRYEEAAVVLQEVIDTPHAWLENRIEACRALYNVYLKMDEPQKGIRALFSSLELDTPRAEICCDIGTHLFNNKNFKVAAFWYETALTCVRNDSSGAFISPDCYGYLPHIQLSVCYHKLGNLEKAIMHNDEAGKIKPDNASYIHNKKFFDSVTKKK